MTKLQLNQKIKIKDIFTNEIIEGFVSNIRPTTDYTRMITIESKIPLVISEHHLQLRYEVL
jgi:hypothetical protein